MTTASEFLWCFTAKAQLKLYQKIPRHELAAHKFATLIKLERTHQAQISPAGGEQGIDFVGGGQMTPDHCGQAGLAAQPIAEGGQKAGAIGGIGFGRGLAGQYFD